MKSLPGNDPNIIKKYVVIIKNYQYQVTILRMSRHRRMARIMISILMIKIVVIAATILCL